MPKDSYNSRKKHIKNAKLIMQNKMRCGKIEDYKNNFKIIELLVKKKIPVMGHIGHTPQFKNKFKVGGQSLKETQYLLKKAKLIERAGAFSIVLECVTSSAAKQITDQIDIPTIGIGSSLNCDGQILVTDDMLGLSGFYPKFVKKYTNLNRIIEKAVKKYTRDIKLNNFPTKKNSFT